MHRTALVAIVCLGAFALGPSGPPSVIEARQPDEIKDLTQALAHASSPEPGERIRGLEAIPRFAPAKRDELVARVIERAFLNGSPEVRVAACRVTGELSKIAPEYRTLSPFPEMLGSPEKMIRMAALENLNPRWDGYSQDDVRALVRLLKDTDPMIRFHAYGHLGAAGGRACLRSSGDIVMVASGAVIENLESESAEEDPAAKQNLLRAAVRTLGKIGRRSPKAVPALLKVYDRFSAATDRDIKMRGEVVEALAEIGPFSDKSLPFLAKLMRDEKRPLAERASAARAIGKFGPTAADLVPEMLALLRTELKQPGPSRGAGSEIIDAFVWLGEAAGPAVPLLLELAQGPSDVAVTEYAIRALGDLGPVAAKLAAPVLGKLYFAKERHSLEDHFARSLAQFDENGARLAIDALKSNDVSLQSRALKLVEQLGPFAPAAMPELKRIAADDKHQLQIHAQSVIQRINRYR